MWKRDVDEIYETQIQRRADRSADVSETLQRSFDNKQIIVDVH